MFEEALDQDQAAQEGQWGDTRDVAPPQTQPQAQGQPQDGQWGDTRGPEPTGANPVSVNPSAAALTQMERGPEVRMPQMPATVNEAVKDTGDVLQRVAEGQGAGMAKDFADAIAGTDPGAGDRAKEHFSNFMLFLRNDPQRAWEELGKSGQSMVDVGKRIGEGDWRGAAGAASGAIYHGIAGIPLVGGQLKGIADENNAGHYKEGAADAFNFFSQFLHPETGEKQLVAAPEVGLKFGRDPKALEAQQYIMSKGAPANAAAATASPFVKAIQKGTEMTPLAAYTSESSHLKAMGVVGDIAEELKKRNAAGAQVPETAGAGAQAALEAKIGMAHDAANKEYGEFRRMQADPANVKNVQIGSQTIDTGLLDAQGNKITRVQPIMEKVGLPVDISPLMDKLRPLYDELREEMPISRQEASPGFTVLSNIVNSNKSVISAAKAESALGAIKSLTREASEGRGQGLAKYVTPQLEQLIDRAIDIPIDATGLKTGLQPVLQRLQQRMTPQQLLALPGIRDLSTFLKGPDQLRASQFKATLQNLNALAGEDAALPGVLKQAADDVRAKDPAGALERGRAATSAKYVTKDVLEQMRTEPVQAFNQLTYANDAGIDFLRQVNKEVPGQARNIGRAYMEKLFDQKPDKMFASWGNLGPSTKKILFDPGVANEMDKLVRAARDNAANPNPSGTAVVLGATAGLGGLILHPIAATPTIIGGAALSKLLRSQLGVRLLTEGITVPIHAPRAAVIINTLRRIAGTEIGPRAEKTAGNTDQTDWKYATGGKVHYDDGGDVQQDNYDPSQDPVLRKLEQERQARLGFTPSTAVTGGAQVGTSADPNAVAAVERGPNLLPAGQQTPPPKFQDPIAGFLGQSADKMRTGWHNLWEPQDTTAADPNWWDKKAQAASDVIQGAGPFALPLGIPAAAAAPLPAIGGALAGLGAGVGTKALAEQAGVPPGRAALMGDISGLAAGAVGSEVAPEAAAAAKRAPGAIQDFINRLDYTGGNPERGSARLWMPGRTRLADINEDYVVPAAGAALRKEDVMNYLQGRVQQRLGAIHPDAPPDVKLQRLLRLGRTELTDQLSQPNPNLDFYIVDSPQANADMIQMFPELATDSARMNLVKAASATLAQGSNPGTEAQSGGRAYNYYRQHGRLPEVQPNDGIPGSNPGSQWSTTAGSDPIIKLNKFIDMFKSQQDPSGLIGLERILTGKYPVALLKHFNPWIDGPAGKIVPGAMILGPKIGSYFLDISGIPQEGATVDMWDTLAQHRRMGNMFTETGKPIVTPSVANRQIFQDFHRTLESEFGLDRTQSQSGLWHYEKELYRRLGVPTLVKGRSDGTQSLLDAWGHQRQNVITRQNAPPPPIRGSWTPPQIP